MSIFYGGNRRSGLFRKHKKRKIYKTEGQRQVVFWLRIVITLAVLLILALSITGIYKGTRHPSVTISLVDAKGGETIDTAEVVYRAEELLQGTYLYIIPRSFAYLYPHDEIVEAVERISRIHHVSVERSSPTSLEIRFDEYVPFALWCESFDASSTAACLFLDRTGYAFSEAPHLTGSSFVRYVTEDRSPEVGVQILPTEELTIFSEFSHALRTRHMLRVQAVTKTKDNDIAYELVGGGTVLVSGAAPIQEVFDTLDSVLASEEFAHLEPGNFEYIDIRFDEKVYVKEVSEEVSPEVSEEIFQD